MKRISMIILGGLTLVLPLAACGDDSDSPAPSSSVVSTTQPASNSAHPGATTHPGTTAPANPGTTAPAKPGTTAPANPGNPTTTVVMIPNPNGDGSMVPCEGTICTNPNYGGGDENPGNDDPACEGTICTNPNYGGGDDNPGNDDPACEGTICTNPNYGGGDNPDGDDGPIEPGQDEFEPES